MDTIDVSVKFRKKFNIVAEFKVGFRKCEVKVLLAGISPRSKITQCLLCPRSSQGGICRKDHVVMFPQHKITCSHEPVSRVKVIHKL